MLLALIAAIVLAQEAVTTAPPLPSSPPQTAAAPAAPAGPPPGDLSAAPPLPEGPLLPVARSDSGETFLVSDTVSKTGDVADFWTFEAFTPPVRIKEGIFVVQGLTHHQVDCGKQTDQTMASAGYDEGGLAVVALAAAAAEPLAPKGAYGLIAGVLCKGDVPPKTDAVAGHAAALAVARAR